MDSWLESSLRVVPVPNKWVLRALVPISVVQVLDKHVNIGSLDP